MLSGLVAVGSFMTLMLLLRFWVLGESGLNQYFMVWVLGFQGYLGSRLLRFWCFCVLGLGF